MNIVNKRKRLFLSRSSRHVALDKVLTPEGNTSFVALAGNLGIQVRVNTWLVHNRRDVLRMSSFDDVAPEDVLRLDDQLSLNTLAVLGRFVRDDEASALAAGGFENTR